MGYDHKINLTDYSITLILNLNFTLKQIKLNKNSIENSEMTSKSASHEWWTAKCQSSGRELKGGLQATGRMEHPDSPRTEKELLHE